jgi:hypothetical protein
VERAGRIASSLTGVNDRQAHTLKGETRRQRQQRRKEGGEPPPPPPIGSLTHTTSH